MIIEVVSLASTVCIIGLNRQATEQDPWPWKLYYGLDGLAI